jgi:amino acid permease
LKWRPAKARTFRESPSGSPSRAVPLLPSSIGAQAIRNDTISETRFAAITTAIIVFSYIVAMTVSSLDRVLAYVGSTGSTSISFILPGLFFYKISAPDSIHHQRLTKEDDDEYDESFDQGFFLRGTPTSAWRTILLRRLALALAMYGFLVMIVCLIINTFFIVAH